MRAKTSFAALSALIALCACSSPLNTDRAAFLYRPQAQSVPRLGMPPFHSQGAVLLDVRLDAQEKSNGCGAHALASVINYWVRIGGHPIPPVTGAQIYTLTPPKSGSGYSLKELESLARSYGLTALAVTLTHTGILNEVSAGRPVIVRVNLPAAYQRNRHFLPSVVPFRWLEGMATDRLSAMTGAVEALSLDHYWIVAGYDAEAMIVLDPALGLRRIRKDRFEIYFNRGGRLGVVISA